MVDFSALNIHSQAQLSHVYSVAEDIISNLDEYALAEVFSSGERDLDKIIDALVIETSNAYFSKGRKVASVNFGYLESLTNQVDLALRKLIFNYFVVTTMPDFEMNWHHIEWGNMVQLYKLLCIEAARDHSKSFTFAYAYPVWKMFRYEKRDFIKGRFNYECSLSKEGMLITNEFKLGKKHLRRIKEEIDLNDYLKDALRPEAREGWGKEELYCKNGSSMTLGSFGTSLRGPHPGWIVVDDFLDKSCLYSFDMRQKFVETFHGEIMNMILPDGQVVVIGTPFHEEDLYGDLKKKKGWKVFEYPAIFPDGSLLWENRYDLDALLQKKEDQGSIIFSREILVKPVSSESSVFPYEIVKRAFVGMENYKLVNNYYSFPKKFDRIVVGTDFAISAGVGADASCFIVIGVIGDEYWIIHITRMVGASYDQQMATLKLINQNFRPDIVVIETNAMQKVFYQMAQDAGLPVVEHTTTADKWSLTEGLPGMSVLFEQGRVRIPRGDQKSIDITDLLASELTSFTFDEDKNKLTSVAGHGDIAMALWQGIRGAHYAGGGFTYSFI